MPIVKKALLVFLFLVFAVLMLPGIIQPPPDTATAEKMQVKGLSDALSAALLEYQEAYGQFPEGDAGQILSALRGGNEKKTVFFDPASDSVNEGGELVDPWLTPFRISFDPAKELPKIQAAGPNRKFDEKGHHLLFSDDYYSWQ